MKILEKTRSHFQFISGNYKHRKQLREPDLRVWEFVVQMLISAYFSWRWLDSKFEFWNLQYWAWLSQYSSIQELKVRAALAVDAIDKKYKTERNKAIQEEGKRIVDQVAARKEWNIEESDRP